MHRLIELNQEEKCIHLSLFRFPGLDAQLNGPTSVPQSLVGMTTALPGALGSMLLPNVPMVSPMGMTGMPSMMNHSSNIMPPLLPTHSIMAGSNLGMGPGAQLPPNNLPLQMSQAIGLGLLEGPQRGSLPQDLPFIM